MTVVCQQAHGSYTLSLPGSGDAPIPMVETHKDTGSFVNALVHSPPGVHLLGVSQMMSWNEYAAL